MQGKLFTQTFLEQGITQTEAWQNLNQPEYAQFAQTLKAIFANFSADSNLNEASTETEIIWKVLSALDWHDTLPQQTASAKGRYDIPDGLLFPDQQAKAAALAETKEELRYQNGLVILESKRWQRALDRADKTDTLDKSTPSTQMLRYLSRAEVISERRIQWGILTNGRHWRLYWQGARSRSEDFLELDLAVAIGMPDLKTAPGSVEAENPEHFLNIFYLLFRRQAFLPQALEPSQRDFHQIALDEGQHWQTRVSQDLGQVVFTHVFPTLVKALVQYDPQAPNPFTSDYLETVRHAALTLLYRLLFLFYAEDRNLLPIHEIRYAHYALRKTRHDIAQFIDKGDGFSATAQCYHAILLALYQMIAQGDTAIGLPPYNGGLFEKHPLLERAHLPDMVLAKLIDNLSRRTENEKRQWINYHDLSVQQLGSIYERLLEFAVVVNEANEITIQPNIYARKGSGSYYTHDELVKLVITETLEPLIQERVAAFDALTTAEERAAKSKRLQQLEALDPASGLLELKICDPAMGSGHFLVSLVDYLADHILEQMANAEVLVNWATYQSPLIQRIENIRQQILAAAEAQKWTISRHQLSDRHIVRRLILKRVIYGVDKNPMAVELAKLALWLHTFTVGAPLSFLDHHLRCGDSLFGEWVGVVSQELQELGAIFMQNALAGISAATQMMNDISELTDADIAEVTQSKSLFESVEKTLKPLHQLLDFWHALRWLSPEKFNQNGKAFRHSGLAPLLSGHFGDLMTVVSKGQVTSEKSKDKKEVAAINDLLAQTRAIASQKLFFHWEIAFSTVWKHLERSQSVGGFDIVISNPPWERVKLQEIEWFALHKAEIAAAPRAADRKKLIAQLQSDALWEAYTEAKMSAETAAKVARTFGEYPLLSGGDINLYALFVERAQRLAAPEGVIGLVTPSGIASDKGSSHFFKSVATNGRLKTLLDFENKKVFFPDVHASFKFCAFIFGGRERQFTETQCAFFLHSVSERHDPERLLTLSTMDLAAVNPNTGTMPIFRSKRDAEITTRIYKQFPLLVDRRTDGPKFLWPLRYVNMFHLTNDSHLFKRQDELDEEGFYPVGMNMWRRGIDECVPLYEGKMVQAYDHRAASIVLNPENIHRPAQPKPASLEQHHNPKWLPTPQFWIETQAVEAFQKLGWVLVFKEITAATNKRTVISAIAPSYGFGNTAPIFIPSEPDSDRSYVPLFLANLNSFILDFIARQKVQGQHLNLYILEQLPFIPPSTYEKRIGDKKIADFIREQVLHLSYTAVDMRPFAIDMGYEGEPFVWDEDDRRHRIARLDALFFHLYQLDKNEARYILEQFPIVRANDEKIFGHYLTCDLILGYMNAIGAGDLESVVQISSL